MPNVSTVFARSVRKIAKAAARHGNSRDLLRSVGLDRDTIDHPSFRIPYADMMLLSEHAARLTRDDAFGLHVGEQVEMREYGVIGEAISTSPTLGDALRTLARYLPIWTDVGIFSLQVERGVGEFRWEYSDRSLPDSRHDCEISMATLARFANFSNDKRPREVWFQHARPKDMSEYARLFRAPVYFRMPANTMVLDHCVLDSPLKSADRNAHTANIEKAELLLSNAGEKVSFAQCVLSFIRQELENGAIDLNSAAQRLGVSRRTLQRRLDHESVSYRQLVRQARRELSRFLLCGDRQTATDTAYALGYSDSSAFQHAFHKWHGIPPGEYKDRMSGPLEK
jgi:AraC-like DNA-binding protein